MNETHDNGVSLCQLIKRRRKALRLKQAQVAEQLHVEPESVGLWEHGRRRMELDKLPRVAAILKLNGKYLCRLALFEWHPRLYAELFGAAGPRQPQLMEPSAPDHAGHPLSSGAATQAGTGPLKSAIIVGDRLRQGEEFA